MGRCRGGSTSWREGDPAGLNARDPTSVLDVSGIVRRLRRTSDLSQRDLARMVGIDQSQIARIEASHRGIDVQLFAQILEWGACDSRSSTLTGWRSLPSAKTSCATMPADGCQHILMCSARESCRTSHFEARVTIERPLAPGITTVVLAINVGAELGIGPNDDQPTRSDIAAVERARERPVSWRPAGERAHCSPTTAPAFPRAGSTRVARRAANAGAVGERGRDQKSRRAPRSAAR